jgi:hypothetical protein
MTTSTFFISSAGNFIGIKSDPVKFKNKVNIVIYCNASVLISYWEISLQNKKNEISFTFSFTRGLFASRFYRLYKTSAKDPGVTQTNAAGSRSDFLFTFLTLSG